MSNGTSTNFLAPQGFQLGIQAFPDVGFYAQQCSIPGITLPNAIQSTRFSDIPVAGDKMQWDNFTINFMIDANMANYLAIWTWLTNLGHVSDDTSFDHNKQTSTGVMQILGANNVAIRTVFFEDLLPISLQTINFTSTDSDVTYIQGVCEFMYSTYKIE